MHQEQIFYAGNTTDATNALIMIHGRGASAEDILSLSENLNIPAVFARSAAGNRSQLVSKIFFGSPEGK